MDELMTKRPYTNEQRRRTASDRVSNNWYATKPNMADVSEFIVDRSREWLARDAVDSSQNVAHYQTIRPNCLHSALIILEPLPPSCLNCINKKILNLCVLTEPQYTVPQKMSLL